MKNTLTLLTALLFSLVAAVTHAANAPAVAPGAVRVPNLSRRWSAGHLTTLLPQSHKARVLTAYKKGTRKDDLATQRGQSPKDGNFSFDAPA